MGWLVELYDASDALSVALSIIACPSVPAIRFGRIAFCFPLSTHAYQAYAEGRGCLPFTREAGVVGIPLARHHFTCMDMQLRKSNDFRRSSPTLAGNFERTGRTFDKLSTSFTDSRGFFNLYPPLSA
jgi:hypothetical protein